MNELVEAARRMVPSLSRECEGVAIVYLLQLKSGVIYTGCTLDLESRLNAHVAGLAGRTTHFDPPVLLLRIEQFPDFTTARRREAQLKRWSRAKKEALIAGDTETLQQLSKSRNDPDFGLGSKRRQRAHPPSTSSGPFDARLSPIRSSVPR